MIRSFSRLVLVLVALIPLTSCYLPVYFDAEIEVDRTGYYSFIFDGYMTRVEFYKDVKEGKLSREKELEQAKLIENDFKRDSSTKEFKYMKDGIFKIHWEKKGDLLRSKSVTFFRRNENMLSLTYLREQGVILVEGAPISPTNAKRLQEIGLGIEGQLRVKTTAPIRRTNAGRELKGKEARQKILVWDIKSLYDPKPYLMLNMR